MNAMNHERFVQPKPKANGQPGRHISIEERAEIIRLLEITDPPLPYVRIARLTRRSIESISAIARETGHANSVQRAVAMFAHECVKVQPVPMSGYATRMERVLHAFKQMSGIAPRCIIGPARSQTISIARQPVVLAATRCGLSLTMIGKALGNRNHTTIRHARRVAEYYYARDVNYRALVDQLVISGAA